MTKKRPRWPAFLEAMKIVTRKGYDEGPVVASLDEKNREGAWEEDVQAALGGDPLPALRRALVINTAPPPAAATLGDDPWTELERALASANVPAAAALSLARACEREREIRQGKRKRRRPPVYRGGDLYRLRKWWGKAKERRALARYFELGKGEERLAAEERVRIVEKEFGIVRRIAYMARGGASRRIRRGLQDPED